MKEEVDMSGSFHDVPRERLSACDVLRMHSSPLDVIRLKLHIVGWYELVQNIPVSFSSLILGFPFRAKIPGPRHHAWYGIGRMKVISTVRRSPYQSYSNLYIEDFAHPTVISSGK